MIKTLSKIYQFSGKMQETMKKAILFSVLHSLFDMMSFGALAMVFSGLTDGFTTSMIWMIFGITLASMLLKIYCSYISDFGKVQIGYFMCAEKRIQYWRSHEIYASGGISRSQFGEFDFCRHYDYGRY